MITSYGAKITFIVAEIICKVAVVRGLDYVCRG